MNNLTLLKFYNGLLIPMKSLLGNPSILMANSTKQNVVEVKHNRNLGNYSENNLKISN